MTTLKSTVFFLNKKLIRNYQLLDSLIVGILLKGWETRAIFAHQFNLSNAFVIFRHNEMFLLNFEISPKFSGKVQIAVNHKLLATKSQILQFQHLKTAQHVTIIPTHILILNGKIKIKLALARGLKHHQFKHLEIERDWLKKRRHTFKKE